MSTLVATLMIQALSVTVADRSELRLRDGSVTQQSSPQLDATTLPRLTLNLEKSRAAWGLTYGAQLSEYSVGTNENTHLTAHSASLFGALRLTRRDTLTLREMASYGWRNLRLALLAPEANTPASSTSNTSGATSSTASPASSVLLASQTIGVASTTSGAEFAHQFSATSRESTLLDYTVSTGINTQSRVTYPLAETLHARESVTNDVSRRHAVSIIADGALLKMPSVMTYQTVALEAQWRTALNAGTTVSLTLGPAYWHWSPNQGADQHGVSPSASGSLNYTTRVEHGVLHASAVERFGHIVDRLLGTQYDQWVNALTVDYTKGRMTLASGANTGVSSGNAVRSYTYFATMFESISYRLVNHVTGELGSNQSTYALAGSSSSLFWAAYVAITVSSPTQRL